MYLGIMTTAPSQIQKPTLSVATLTRKLSLDVSSAPITPLLRNEIRPCRNVQVPWFSRFFDRRASSTKEVRNRLLSWPDRSDRKFRSASTCPSISVLPPPLAPKKLRLEENYSRLKNMTVNKSSATQLDIENDDVFDLSYLESSLPNLGEEVHRLKEEFEGVKKVKEGMSTQIEELELRLSDYRCKICLDRQANRTFLPCKHASICSDCYRKLQMRRCPVCRALIERSFEIFFA